MWSAMCWLAKYPFYPSLATRHACPPSAYCHSAAAAAGPAASCPGALPQRPPHEHAHAHLLCCPAPLVPRRRDCHTSSCAPPRGCCSLGANCAPSPPPVSSPFGTQSPLPSAASSWRAPRMGRACLSPGRRAQPCCVYPGALAARRPRRDVLAHGAGRCALLPQLHQALLHDRLPLRLRPRPRSSSPLGTTHSPPSRSSMPRWRRTSATLQFASCAHGGEQAGSLLPVQCAHGEEEEEQAGAQAQLCRAGPKHSASTAMASWRPKAQQPAAAAIAAHRWRRATREGSAPQAGRVRCGSVRPVGRWARA